MNKDVFRDYSDLVSAAKKYLFQEYRYGGRLSVDNANYEYFKSLYLKSKKPTAPLTTTPSPNESSFTIPSHQAARLTEAVESTSKADEKIQHSSTDSRRDILSAELQDDKTFPVPAVTAELEPPKEENISLEGRRFALEQPSEAEIPDFTHLRKLWKEKFPQIALLDEIACEPPSSSIVMGSDSAEVLIICFHDVAREKRFLRNIALAINYNLVPAQLIIANGVDPCERLNKLFASKRLKLLIASLHSLCSMPELYKLYREEASNGTAFLADLPLIALADLAHYMAEPQLKVKLWKTIVDKLNG